MGDVTIRVAEALERAAHLDPLLGTFRHRFPREATAAAAGLDAAPSRTGPLHGLTLGVKDIIATRESAPVTCQSPVHDPHWWAGRDAPVIARLRAAGVVVLGRTTLAEHALGRPDPALGLPVPRNPWDLDRWPGGSSCGSANGLPAGLFDVGIGTDTNGSLRIPAALCGVTALKPTYGLVPTGGCHPLSPSLDVVGPLARTARDCADVLAVMAGGDHPTTATSTGPTTSAGPTASIGPAASAGPRVDLRGVRIGVPARALAESGQLSDPCQAAFEQARRDLESLGAQLVEIELPEVHQLFAAQFLTLLAEGYAHHSAALIRRWHDYGRPFRRTLVLGGLLTEETRHRAHQVRASCAAALRHRMTDLDAVATPTWPTVAPRYDDPGALTDVSWLPGIWSAVGFPALALPMGRDAAGLPLSLQLAGLPGTDFALAALADVYQQHTDWHLHEPAPYGTTTLAPIPEPAPADPVEPEVLHRMTEALHGLGLRIDAAETATLCARWNLLSVLPAFLPDTPADHRPL